ncbi:hypothetical protein CN97_17515 [Haematobacter massiliensis]|uniref:Uncharacterized protein n=1 Tax=Haematobacter massiliensis TaxID=195105 RepID=A0A086Y3A2_9RHOB|nr:hypothetical protein CN97_17515 [Haematobacter massiliensis]
MILEVISEAAAVSHLDRAVPERGDADGRLDIQKVFRQFGAARTAGRTTGEGCGQGRGPVAHVPLPTGAEPGNHGIGPDIDVPDSAGAQPERRQRRILIVHGKGRDGAPLAKALRVEECLGKAEHRLDLHHLELNGAGRFGKEAMGTGGRTAAHAHRVLQRHGAVFVKVVARVSPAPGQVPASPLSQSIDTCVQAVGGGRGMPVTAVETAVVIADCNARPKALPIAVGAQANAAGAEARGGEIAVSRRVQLAGFPIQPEQPGFAEGRSLHRA